RLATPAGRLKMGPSAMADAEEVDQMPRSNVPSVLRSKLIVAGLVCEPSPKTFNAVAGLASLSAAVTAGLMTLFLLVRNLVRSLAYAPRRFRCQPSASSPASAREDVHV